MIRSSTLGRWSRLGLIALSAASLIASVPASADPRHGRYDRHNHDRNHHDRNHRHHHHGGSKSDSSAGIAALAVLGVIGIAALAASAQPSAVPMAPPYPQPYPPAPYPMTSSGQTGIYQPPPAAAWSPPLSAEPIAPAYVTADGRTCQAYQSTASIDGYQRPVQGTACRERDGVWRVVN